MFKLLARKCYFSNQAFNISKNYYQILKVKQTDSLSIIKRSFKQLAKKYHPDFNKGKEELFKEINEAYQILSDQSIRKQYDSARKGSSSQEQYSPNERQYRNKSPQYQNQSYYNKYYANQEPRRGQNSFYHQYENPYGSEYSNHMNAKARQKQRQQSRDYSTQELHRMFLQQQADFMKRYHETQNESLNRRKTTQSLKEEYMRQYMDHLRAKEERQRQIEQQQRKVDQEYERSKEKIKQQVFKTKAELKNIVSGVGSAVKELWNLYKNNKDKK